jgi:hypothetical protein
MLLPGAALFGALLLAQALLGVSKGPLFQRSNGSHRILTSDESTGDGDRSTAAGMNLRGAVTPLLVALLSRCFGWQGALLSIALPVALLTVTWGWYGRNRPREHASVTAGAAAALVLCAGAGLTRATHPRHAALKGAAKMPATPSAVDTGGRRRAT